MMLEPVSNSPRICNSAEVFGVVAGNGQFPVELLERLRAAHTPAVVAAHLKQTDPIVERLADEVHWVKFGQLRSIISFFVSHKVSKVIFLGGIRRKRLFDGFVPDLTVMRVLLRARSLRDDAVLRAVCYEFESRNMVVINPIEILTDFGCRAGVLTSREFTSSERSDSLIGWRAAKEHGARDLGQSVIVRNGEVV
ncbi:MAG: hypothetical protein KDD60_08545, partial [Bdellovibrionales bacterium]|nr:hypothetical protein [Bdellovibrionales bacterium]